ncbi:Alpha-ketoglutarate-dependent 2,4-dichlorophenoxyacetate dioxygenase [Geodia barretti]|uniref:Alpha-ketoglutarate-dependent 2,4-dichlorophenoxyacetate dioxygenase n=1 Tax=Geodia barretti TaxID=519541 RepID=A0AA35XF58_GEOBA|nr:Alpha-ketoglutarate-dependent 2,4-dichlorophenoxyacetate dioxygenase [Geodia barretti]
MDEAFQKNTPPANQRLVRTLPETGKKALLVGSYTTRIHGLPIEEGKALLKELLEWSTQPQFVYRHTWRVNDSLCMTTVAACTGDGLGIAESTSACFTAQP